MITEEKRMEIIEYLENELDFSYCSLCGGTSYDCLHCDAADSLWKLGHSAAADITAMIEKILEEK